MMERTPTMQRYSVLFLLTFGMMLPFAETDSLRTRLLSLVAGTMKT